MYIFDAWVTLGAHRNGTKTVVTVPEYWSSKTDFFQSSWEQFYIVPIKIRCEFLRSSGCEKRDRTLRVKLSS